MGTQLWRREEASLVCVCVSDLEVLGFRVWLTVWVQTGLRVCLRFWGTWGMP